MFKTIIAALQMLEVDYEEIVYDRGNREIRFGNEQLYWNYSVSCYEGIYTIYKMDGWEDDFKEVESYLEFAKLEKAVMGLLVNVG